MRSKVKTLLKNGLSEAKLNEIGNKTVSSRLDVNEYVRRLKAEGAVEKKNGEFRFHDDHHIMH